MQGVGGAGRDEHNPKAWKWAILLRTCGVQCIHDLVKCPVTRDKNQGDSFCALGWSEATDVLEEESTSVARMLCRDNFIGCEPMRSEKWKNRLCCQLGTLTVSTRWIVHDNERHRGQVTINDKIR